MTEATDLVILLDEINRKADKSWLPTYDVIRHEIRKLIKNNPGFTPEEVEVMKAIAGGFGAALLRAAAPALPLYSGLFTLGKQEKTAESRLAELRSMVSQRVDT